MTEEFTLHIGGGAIVLLALVAICAVIYLFGPPR